MFFQYPWESGPLLNTNRGGMDGGEGGALKGGGGNFRQDVKSIIKLKNKSPVGAAKSKSST